jgi:hypothetical protein
MLWQKYIHEIQTGKRNAGELEKLAVERFLHLCKNDRYYFDADHAASILEIVGMFKHTKGSFKGVSV